MKGNIDKTEESIEGRNGDRQRMALDMIDAIRSAEDAAAEIRKRAQDSSREILQKARENGETLVRKAEVDARREASKIAERSDAEIFARRDAAQKEEAARKSEALKNGESRLDSAVDFLITRLKKEKNAP